MDPTGRIRVPLVLLIGEGAQPSLDVFAPLRIVECSAQRVCDERAASPSAHAAVELLHQLVIEAYVQTHGHKLAHSYRGPLQANHAAPAISCARASISPAPTASSRSATRRPSASGS